jgi:MbtH protein
LDRLFAAGREDDVQQGDDREDEDDGLYAVVVNLEQQFSIWPADREPPAGWTETGTRGTRTECLRHIEATWTDMRPLSVREPRPPDPDTLPRRGS